MAAALAPTDVPRRSFVYRELQAAGAEFAPLNGAAVAVAYGRPAGEEQVSAHRLGLADLSPLPRTGFKGNGAVEWLAAQGVAVGPDSNRAYGQGDGALAARLAPTEVLILDGLAGEGALIGWLDRAWAWAPAAPRPPMGYPVPRADSHCWFCVTGAAAPEMFAKICGVDLRTSRFPYGQIAQTSVAKIGGIVIRRDVGGVPGFYLLADSASAAYLWRCVLDAMDEFGGRPVGLAALRALEAAGGG